MTHQESNRILEWNKAIAEFMGYYYDESMGVFRVNGTGHRVWGYLKYHESWNQLMPVIEKIESIHDDYHGYFAVHIVSNSCTIQGTKFDSRPESFHPAYFADHYHDTKLLATCEAVVSFIQWYTTKQSADE